MIADDVIIAYFRGKVYTKTPAAPDISRVRQTKTRGIQGLRAFAIILLRAVR